MQRSRRLPFLRANSVTTPSISTSYACLCAELLAPPQRLPLGIPIKIAGQSAEFQESSLLPVTPLPHFDDS